MSEPKDISPNIRLRPPDENPLLDGLDPAQASDQGSVEIDLDKYSASCICTRCRHADICVIGRALGEMLSQAIAQPGTGLVGVLSGCSRFAALSDPEP